MLGWNNTRRTLAYWMSLLALASSVFTIYTFDMSSIDLSKPGVEPFYNWFCFFEDLLYWMVPGQGHLFMEIALVMSLIGAVVALWLIVSVLNLLATQLPNLPLWLRDPKLRFLRKSTVLLDLVLGASVEALALIGAIRYRSFFEIHVMALAWFLMFGFGSIYYWLSVLTVWRYRKLANCIKDHLYWQPGVWYTLTNGPFSLSSYSRAPRPREKDLSFLDMEDILRTGESDLELLRFSRFVIAIDERFPCGDELVSTIRLILRLPHAQIAVFYSARDHREGTEALIRLLSEYKTVRLKRLELLKVEEAFPLERLLSELEFPAQAEWKMPPVFLPEPSLLRAYSECGGGPKVCMDFMTIVLQELSTAPGIYALFDYIDLCYRLRLAQLGGLDYKWMKSKSKVIGSLSRMGATLKAHFPEIVDPTCQPMGTDEMLASILSERELHLVQKYLPNYKVKSDETGFDTVRYLSSNLRNVLRGHGSFEQEDLEELFQIVFKLAILNAVYLRINRIHLETTGERVWKGKSLYKVVCLGSEGKRESVSPFLIADERGKLLIFNNWIKQVETDDPTNCLEYINYLEGTLIRPAYSIAQIP